MEIFVNVRRQQDKHKDDALNNQITDVEHLMKSALCTRHPSKSMSAEDDQNFVEDTQYSVNLFPDLISAQPHLRITLLTILHTRLFLIMFFPLPLSSSTYLQ